MNFALANVTEYILHRILKGSLISTIFNSQIRPPKQKEKSPRYFSVIDLSLRSIEVSLTTFLWNLAYFAFLSFKLGFLNMVWIFGGFFWIFFFNGMRKFENLITVEYSETVRLQAWKAEGREGRLSEQSMDSKGAVILRCSLCTCFMRSVPGAAAADNNWAVWLMKATWIRLLKRAKGGRLKNSDICVSPTFLLSAYIYCREGGKKKDGEERTVVFILIELAELCFVCREMQRESRAVIIYRAVLALWLLPLWWYGDMCWVQTDFISWKLICGHLHDLLRGRDGYEPFAVLMGKVCHVALK